MSIAGRILWFTGGPGTGKSSTAQLLARDCGYVYYEADCFSQARNPFVSLTAEEPSNTQVAQRKLKGPGLEERVEMFTLFGDLLGKITAGLPYDNEVGAKFMEGMARDIKQQKERIGGNWAVAFVANKIARVKAR